MPKLIWSSPQVVMSRRRVCKLGRLYFLLFVFTFKVGKSYENSVNHGGNTSYQTNDKINCHTQASFNLVFQLKLVELWRPNRLNYGHFLEINYTLLFV